MKWILLAKVAMLLNFKVLAADPETWLTTYYQSPNPEKFVTEVIKLSQQGVLSDPKRQQSLAVFLGRILIANPNQTNQWLSALGTLNKKDTQTLYYTAWLADTKESKAYLQSVNAQSLLNSKAINYLEIDIKSPKTLDNLWSYFFATGQIAPIRRIVSALNYAEYSGALKAYKTSKQTNEDKRKAKIDAIFQAARWSIGSNIKQHSKVAEICADILKNTQLTNNEELWLSIVLAKALPNQYKM
ncbi:hypothetical protein RS130_09390 [Paraglaciecola aquimarina]|uniref:Uncharacterized protein n=1 Tax=Paraglaciecola aquimarina TaxID=1235557 RepID=A0ABU3SVS5_9ALTE|nr:hypothetical protein [Paraglaciecola aquimarina]MDU0354120.1 hypothetical protein [Paraglaciecola aquimarina]